MLARQLRAVLAFIIVSFLLSTSVIEAALPRTPPGKWTGADWIQLTSEEQHAFLLGAIYMTLHLSLSFIPTAEGRQQLMDEMARDWDLESVPTIVRTLNEYMENVGTDGLLFDLLDECCSRLWR